jgi:tripartite-type tricarboxylate transporter receptor subunit TctC
MKRLRSASTLVASLALILSVAPVSAQTGPDLAGRTVSVIIGFGTGGGYDVLGRAVARHLGRHLPGSRRS